MYPQNREVIKRMKIPIPTPNTLLAGLVGMIEGAKVVELLAVVVDTVGVGVVCKSCRLLPEGSPELTESNDS
jgi:xanthosine utilization system XapX-like protein